MSNEVYDFNIGHSTAYAYAKASGDLPEGMTPEEYGELLASYATVGQTAVTAAHTATTKASEAATSATTATNKATEATTAATTATTKAGEASTSASTATSAKDTAVSASQTATTKATEATTAAATATSAATIATTAKDDAVSAKTAAQTAQTGAETAAASVSASAAQIATNAEDISQLKSEFTAVSKIINLIDESQCIDDKYYDPNNGNIINGNHTTQLLPLIPVSVGKYYFYTNFTGSQFFSAVVFNSDKSYSRLISTADIRFSSPVVTITGDEAYIGITLYNTQLGGKTAFVEEKYKGYFVGLQNGANIIPPHFVQNTANFSNTIIVDNKGNGDFTTIMDAVNSITDDSKSNPYTILIKAGVYKETVSIQGGRHISLIGENMKDCIIRDDTGLYENCPLQIGGDFLVENLTVIATHDDNPSMPHTGNKAYAIHIDYAGEGVGIVRNCKLVSHQSSAIGAGTHQDQTIIIDNCELISYTPNGSTWDPSSDWTITPSYGALFVHSETNSNVTGQVLTVKNCMITSANKRNCAFSNSPDGTSNMEINLINNNMWCADGNADSTITEWYSPVYSGRSYGNNVAKLNT